MKYKIMFRGNSSSRAEQVNETDDPKEAQYLLREYSMAFKRSGSVFIQEIEK
jgi:hypothetical protein